MILRQLLQNDVALVSHDKAGGRDGSRMRFAIIIRVSVRRRRQRHDDDDDVDDALTATDDARMQSTNKNYDC